MCGKSQAIIKIMSQKAWNALEV